MAWLLAYAGVGLASCVTAHITKYYAKEWANKSLAKERSALYGELRTEATRFSTDLNMVGTAWVKDNTTKQRFYNRFAQLEYAQRHPFSYLATQCPHLHWALKTAPEEFHQCCVNFIIEVDPGKRKQLPSHESQCEYEYFISGGCGPPNKEA